MIWFGDHLPSPRQVDLVIVKCVIPLTPYNSIRVLHAEGVPKTAQIFRVHGGGVRNARERE